MQAKALASQVKSSLRTAARTCAHAFFLVEAMCERIHLYPIFLILNPGQWKALHWSLLHGVRFAKKIFLRLLPDMFLFFTSGQNQTRRLIKSPGS